MWSALFKMLKTVDADDQRRLAWVEERLKNNLLIPAPTPRRTPAEPTLIQQPQPGAS